MANRQWPLYQLLVYLSLLNTEGVGTVVVVL